MRAIRERDYCLEELAEPHPAAGFADQQYVVESRGNGDPLRIVERLTASLSGRLRRPDLTPEDIRSGIERQTYAVVGHRELVEKIRISDAILLISGGGDAAGISDCLRSVHEGLAGRVPVLGVRYAGDGLSVDPSEFLDELVVVDDLLAASWNWRASTPLGSARINPLDDGRIASTIENLKRVKLLCGTGGNGQLTLMKKLARYLPTIGALKTIDGDARVNGVDVQALGFDSARTHAQRSIYAAAASASAHRQVQVTEIFGRHCGSLAFEAARPDPMNFHELQSSMKAKLIELGPTIMILVPERPTSFQNVVDEAKKRKQMYGSCLIVVAEAFVPPELRVEIDRLAGQEELKTAYLSGALDPRRVCGLVEHPQLRSILQEHEALALNFMKICWGETERDAFGKLSKISGITRFVSGALKALGAATKVNEAIENYALRGAEVVEYDHIAAEKLGRAMAQVITQGFEGAKVAVFPHGVDARCNEPQVWDLETVTSQNDLNNGQYNDEALRRGGVFW